MYISLLEEYGAKCAILGNNELLRTISFSSFNNRAETTKKFYEGAEGLSKDIIDCIERGEKMIAIPLNFNTKTEAHYNMLIYRPDEKTIERIEPHGQKFFGYEKNENEIINTTLKVMFEKKMKPYLKKYTPKYIPPNDICPIERGFQALEGEIKSLEQEGGGFCNMWSLFFLELIFLNPTLSTKEVLIKALDITKRDPQYIKNIIRGYVKKTEIATDKFLKRIKETDGFNYKDFKASKKDIYIQKRGNITDELLKYYLNIGSKNTQFELYDDYKKKNPTGKDYYEEDEELKSKYNKLYKYLEDKPINFLNKIFKKLRPDEKIIYKDKDRDLVINFILRVNKREKPDTENMIYKMKLV